MSTGSHRGVDTPRSPARNYLNIHYGVKSWLLTLDHKRIAVLYLVSITLMFFVGGAFAVLIRLELMTLPGDLVQADTYNKLFTMHGLVMIFFFLVPAIPSVATCSTGLAAGNGAKPARPPPAPLPRFDSAPALSSNRRVHGRRHSSRYILQN